MSNVIPFDFESNAIRVVEQDGQPWFVVVDICNALGLTSPHKIAGGLEEDEVTRTIIPGSHRETNIINQSGLYALIFKSRKPQAKKFRKWGNERGDSFDHENGWLRF